MASVNYDLVAIDLDGTLLCPRGRVSERNVRAIAQARAAGIAVTICTGRGLVECLSINEQIGQRDPVVVAGGAMLACPVRRATLHRFPMERGLVGELVECLLAHGHAALLFKDRDASGGTEPGAGTPLAAGQWPMNVGDGVDAEQDENDGAFDYLIVSPAGEPAIDPVSRWWFREHRVPVRIVGSLRNDPFPEHTLRVGCCGTRRETDSAAKEIAHRFGDHVVLHHFAAVAPTETGWAEHGSAADAGAEHPTRSIDAGRQPVILEAFGRDVNKWSAIEWLAGERRIDRRRIAAIGNDINDVVMLRNAGLGVAMANSAPAALEAAGRRTLDNSADGVAHALDQIMTGRW